jgi:glycine C-acetyltransferase
LMEPAIAAGSIKALEMLSASPELRDRLEQNTRFFRERMQAAGFALAEGVHPIVPIMLGDAAIAQKMAARMLDKGIYVIAFSYPVVPRGAARIRTQVSAAHTREDLEEAVRAFAEVKADMGVSG